MDALTRCKGVDNALTPTITETTCPYCGTALELFSTEQSVTCTCGTIVENAQNAPLTINSKVTAHSPIKTP